VKKPIKSTIVFIAVVMLSTAHVRALPISAYDAWAIDYFGSFNSPISAPTADPFGTGQDNFTKFIAGLDPTNSTSLWVLQVSPTNGTLSLAVNFSDNVTTATVTNRLWDFGDGNTGTGATPAHTYSSSGMFSVSETLFSVNGTAMLTETDLVTVVPEPSAFALVALSLFGAMIDLRRR
jgi:PKD repeat protein